MSFSYCDWLSKRIDSFVKKGYLCCSKNCSNCVVQLVPRSCIDWQVSYAGRLFCADIIEPFHQESFL